MTAEQEAAVVVCDGERKAILAVPGAELALEIRTPEIRTPEIRTPEIRTPHSAGRVCHQGYRTGMLMGAASALGLGQPLPSYQVADGRGGRQFKFWLTLGEAGQKLLGSPSRVLPPAGEQSFLHRGRHLVRAGTGEMALVFETVETSLLIPLDPLVACFTTNSEALAELCHGEEVVLMGSEKLEAFVHRVSDFSGHGIPPKKYVMPYGRKYYLSAWFIQKGVRDKRQAQTIHHSPTLFSVRTERPNRQHY